MKPVKRKGFLGGLWRRFIPLIVTSATQIINVWAKVLGDGFVPHKIFNAILHSLFSAAA